ncbi:hypothetical protein HHK36_032068 [Tetracentron sinense]|uniref:HTH myb-type domain-containing protein n=1 Tax=Tetracentron sinense TaxID=13715 RepID=A0A835D0S2_TETSI|nr:hypothetical protein HHK36_032068 [Tetracentron sinense]
MGEEVLHMSDYEGATPGGDEERVHEWEVGLPNADDLTPLFHSLISPELASAFKIILEPCRSMVDVNRAAQDTLSSLRLQTQVFSSNKSKSLPSFTDQRINDTLVVEGDEEDPGSSTKERKLRRLDSIEEGNSDLGIENSNDENSARASKRPRLVWTPQLHKRFVEVVGHLGIKIAVPKTIMQMMNVEGLTRENVASHLQKYRLYLKRMHGFSEDDPSSSDHLFASTPLPQGLHDSSGNGNGHPQMQLPMPFAAPLMPMPVLGVAHGHGHMGMAVGNPGAVAYHGFEQHPYNMFREQQIDWSGNKFGSVVSHPHGDDDHSPSDPVAQIPLLESQMLQQTSFAFSFVLYAAQYFVLNHIIDKNFIPNASSEWKSCCVLPNYAVPTARHLGTGSFDTKGWVWLENLNITLKMRIKATALWGVGFS